MLLFKKLLLLNILGVGIITPTIYYTQSETPIERLELGKTLKEWDQLFQKISGDNDFTKLSKLFSRNLTTFSKSVVINSVKQLLMKWAIQIWENQDAFFPFSQRLNKFFFYFHIHQWKMKNEIEELSWELVKNFFIDFFFKEKGWFFLSKFGDFSAFVLSEWKKREKPMSVYKWTLKYTNTVDGKQITLKEDTLYNKNELTSLKIRSPHLFPEIQGSEEYSSFLSKLKHKGEVELSNFKKTLFTVSDLANLKDGYELGALIHLFAKENNGAQSSAGSGGGNDSIKELDLSTQTGSLDVSSNPLFLFLEPETTAQASRSQENKLSVKQTIFNETIQQSLSSESVGVHNVRWIKKGGNGGGGNGGSSSSTAEKKVLASREKEGISFYYLPKNSKQNGKESEKIDEKDPEVIKKIETFLKENFETIFVKYLSSKKETSQNSYTSFDLTLVNSEQTNKATLEFSEFFKKHQTIINSASEYLEALYLGQRCKALQTILLGVYEFTPEEIEISEEKKITLPTSAGLFSPLKYKRGNGNSEDKDITFPTKNGEMNDLTKYGLFEDLWTFLYKSSQASATTSSSNGQVTLLEAKANELKKQLKNHSDLFTSSTLEELYLKDPFYRAQLDVISKDQLKGAASIFTLKAEELLFPEQGQGEGAQQNQWSTLLEKYISSLGNKPVETQAKQDDGGWKNLVDESFFLEPFLNSSLEKKIFYGSLEQPKAAEGQQNSSVDKKKLTQKAKNSWILDHFYLSDSAYESSSKEYRELLAFLFALKWLTTNDYANMPKLLNHILGKSKNKNAYLLWSRQITEEEKDKLEQDGNSSSSSEPPLPQPQQQDSKLQELFKEKLSEDITNPLLNGELKAEVGYDRSGQSPTKKTYNLGNSIYSVKGFKNGGGSDTKLSGFQGLITETFSTRTISPKLQNYIFKDFLFANSSSKNKNYSAEDSSAGADSQEKLIEGAFFYDNVKRKISSNKELLKLLNNTNTKAKLLKYLDSSINSLNIALENQQEKLDYLTLKELKEALSKGLNTENRLVSAGQSDNKIQHLYKLFNRFSGYLYVSNSNERTPYVFTEGEEKDDSEKKYYVNFLYQVNQFDFEKEGIKELKENLSEETLNTLITLLASNKNIRDWIYESEIIKQINLT